MTPLIGKLMTHHLNHPDSKPFKRKSMGQSLSTYKSKPRPFGIIYAKRGRSDPSLGPDTLFFLLEPQVHRTAKLLRADRLVLNDASLKRIYVKKDNKVCDISVCGPFLGAPHAVMGMEKMIALGAQRFWVLGWCGSIDKSLKVGHIFLPTQAFSDEGTSKHYPMKGKIRPSGDLTKTLEQILLEKGLDYTKGGVWTTDAPYMETPEKMIKFRDRGALVVEMELAALMRVARFRGVGITALLVVSDELFEMKWRPGFSTKELKEATREAADCLLQAALTYKRRRDEQS